MSFAEEMCAIALKAHKIQEQCEIERHKKEIKELIEEASEKGEFELMYEPRTEPYDKVFDWCREKELLATVQQDCYRIIWSPSAINEVRRLNKRLLELRNIA